MYLDRFEQAAALLKPQRVGVLRQLAEPGTCTQVAERLDQTPQWVYYHVKRLVDAGLVSRVDERRVHGIHEGVYQAKARTYWLSPQLVGRIGGPRTRDELSLGFLLDILEEVHTDVAALAETASLEAAPELPSIGLAGEIRVPPHLRKEFLAELKTTMQTLLTRYGGAEGDAFKLAVACYPNVPKEAP
ncbi:helix-turn-helix protein [Prauserella shujinwangii]|uniref:Helix-turn-helix protein n=1 Tax=Prauserella shujinwangii TaxID=1453103 RepID=A0A2T0M2X8_9PSEU|nr:helix-turn-helix protein [Prauserella shujinwangii]